MGKKLVTGATGFTGHALCKRLIQDGENVIAFVRRQSGGSLTALKEIGVECCKVDITNRGDVNNHFRDIDTVYHIAAAYRTEHSNLDEFHQVNVEATGNLLDAAASKGVKRFIHCSTVGVQGEINEPPASEDYRYKPGDHYQQSKMEGELLAIDYSRQGLPVTVVRPVGIYGPGDRRFLKLFRPIRKGTFVMIGSGNSLYHMTFIDDLIEGFILCGSEEKAIGEIFTIAGERYTTLRELVDMIGDVVGRTTPRLHIPYYPVYWASIICEKICRPIGINPPLFPRRVEFFSLDRAFTIDKAKKLLGYQPKVDLHEGLARTAAWYKDEGLI